MHFTVSNEKTVKLSKRHQDLKENNYYFYQCLIPDIIFAVCLDWVCNILKIRTNRKMESINQILDKSCYLTATSNAVILYRNNKPVDATETNSHEKC